MKKIVKRWERNFQGAILPLAIMLVAALIPLAGLSVDIGYYGILRGNLEKATEAASVAGAQEYFRSGADAGMAVNTTVRVFKMNITSDTMVGNYHRSTGMGRPARLSYSKTFTSSDGVNNFYRGADVELEITTDLNRGKVSVTSMVTPNPFFAHFMRNAAMISITKEAELPPYDVVFVVDLSGSMRFATVNTYIGSAYRQPISGGRRRLYNDVVLYQSQRQSWNRNSRITANGYRTTIRNITDVIINTPGTDIPSTAAYSNGNMIYVRDADRGFIVNTDRSIGLRRTDLTGLRISELMNSPISAEDRRLAQTFSDNRSRNSMTVQNYFNRAAPYIEPIASATYGVMTFIDTVRIYGTAALNVGLVTFSSRSRTSNSSSTSSASELRTNGSSKRIRHTYPYLRLDGPSRFAQIVDRLTIMATRGNGTRSSPLTTYSYPNGGTNINAGLDTAKRTLDRSNRRSSEKIIILFTDGAPSHSFSSLGRKVKSLTDDGITIYSVVLTLAVNQNTIDQFRRQIETVGQAEPVIFINNPARLKDAFIQIADELGLKLVS